MKRFWAIVASLVLLACPAQAAPTPAGIQAGDVFEITRDIETSQTAEDSSGSSTDRDTIVVRVVAISQAGLELEYDLPQDTSAEDRARQWQFPARVLKPTNGPLELLNGPELEARAKAWRTAAGIPVAACGHWIFTWTAYRIDCDPLSVIGTINGFDMGPDDLRQGLPYRDADSSGPAPLVRKAASSDGETFVAELTVDPETVRRGEAESDVVVGEITKRPVTLDAALAARVTEDISGTIVITFETDAAGRVRRQTKVTTLTIKRADGQTETRMATAILERRLLSRTGA